MLHLSQRQVLHNSIAETVPRSILLVYFFHRQNFLFRSENSKLLMLRCHDL